MQKRESSCAVGGNANCRSHYGEQCGASLKTEQENYHLTQQSHHWAYTLRKLEPKETRTPVVTAAVITKARMWKQPRCPPADEWMKPRDTRTMEHYSAMRKSAFESA